MLVGPAVVSEIATQRDIEPVWLFKIWSGWLQHRQSAELSPCGVDWKLCIYDEIEVVAERISGHCIATTPAT